MSFTSPALERLRAARERAAQPLAAPLPAPAPQPPGRPLLAPPELPPTRPPIQAPPRPQARREGEHAPTPQPPQSAADGALPSPTLGDMPPHLAHMVAAAARGELPQGAHMLGSGLVMDLTGYVLAWAECWPRDRAHLLRRLEEACAVWGQP